MPYALFTNNEQISKAYKTEHEVWKKADEAGLVIDVASQEEKPHPKRVLDADFCIQPCPADADQQTLETSRESKQDIHRQAAHSNARAGRHTGRRVMAAVKS